MTPYEGQNPHPSWLANAEKLPDPDDEPNNISQQMNESQIQNGSFLDNSGSSEGVEHSSQLNNESFNNILPFTLLYRGMTTSFFRNTNLC